MDVKHFSIKNYRAIKEIDISLRYSLIPIIGINESGKTSILQAILAIDCGTLSVKSSKYKTNGNLFFKKRVTLFVVCSVKSLFMYLYS
jgi:predicted ATP-dependent endonuclease of OLD family